MIGKNLILLFDHDKACLTAEKALRFDQLGLPAYTQSFQGKAYWILKVLSYNSTEKKLYCEILDYQIGHADFYPHQQLLADQLNEIQSISFRSVDTAGLLKTIAGESKPPRPIQYIPVETAEENYEHLTYVEEPIKKTYKDHFFVPIKNLKFKLGGVSFQRRINGINKNLEITIPNYELREEFDAVKNYFSNVLKTKKIEVFVRVNTTNYQITSIRATSPEIASIDKHLIDNVKFEFVGAITKKKLQADVDKSLFTMEEYFDTFAGDAFKPNTFYNNEKELFEDILSISDSKHYKQLRFLSSIHAHHIMKLRFIHKPFSFIFLVQGEKNYHIIWETLDTEEATYIWHSRKDIHELKRMLRKIEDIINVIKVQGKIAYINSSEDTFRRVYHDYSELVEGFVRWKGELESMLT